MDLDLAGIVCQLRIERGDNSSSSIAKTRKSIYSANGI